MAVEVREVEGNLANRLLEGSATIYFANRSQLIGTFHRGVLSGLARVFQCKFEQCDFEENLTWNIPNWLSEVSYK